MRNFIVGNWKMYKTRSEIEHFFKELERSADIVKHSEAWIAPQSIHLDLVRELSAPMGVQVGSQNVAAATEGAFTGEVSSVAVADMGCSFTILGHSERRAIFHETDATLNQKLHLSIKAGLTVIFCCGETLEEREKGEAESVVRHQLVEGLKGLDKTYCHHLMIAYEPVWAIGTGRTASPTQAQEMHGFIRKVLMDEMSFPAKEMPILYGGSVKTSNIDALLQQPDINGALVGGASLKPEDYLILCKASLK